MQNQIDPYEDLTDDEWQTNEAARNEGLARALNGSADGERGDADELDDEPTDDNGDLLETLPDDHRSMDEYMDDERAKNNYE